MEWEQHFHEHYIKPIFEVIQMSKCQLTMPCSLTVKDTDASIQKITEGLTNKGNNNQ